MTRTRAALAAAALCAAVAGCATAPTQYDREAAYWAAYQQRLGLDGGDFGDYAQARAAAVRLGETVCAQLASGMDRAVLVEQIGPAVGGGSEEARVQVDVAAEHLCPDADAA